MRINVLLMDEEIDHFPIQAHPREDAGFDLQTVIDFTVEPGQSIKVPTTFVFDLPTRTYRLGGFLGFGGIPLRLFLQIYNRTGWGVRGLIVVAIIVDSGYRSEPDDPSGLTLVLRNIGTETLSCKRGEKVAQGVFHFAVIPRLRKTRNKKKVRWDTDRRSKRFGDTGK